MKTAHKYYTITTATKATAGDSWAVTMEIVNRDDVHVVAPLYLGDVVFMTEAEAHDAAILLARDWIDGESDGNSRS
jgi:hypothetical protein